MSSLKKIGALAVMGVAAMAAFGVLLYLNHLFREGRDGRVLIVAPLTAPLSATLDGAPIQLAPGEVHRATVSHGEHRLEVTGPEPFSRRFTIDSGRNPRVVPVLAEQCYVELDVTRSHYGEGARPAPSVARVVRHDDVWISLDGLAFTEAELPSSARYSTNSRGDVTNVQLIQLWRPIPCALDGRPDEILRALGYVR